jgi:3-oxoacyl-[acyl-carrier protein] reductase
VSAAPVVPGVLVALVTGAGRAGSLGAALCEKLAAAGYAVAVHYHRSAAGAQALAARLPRARAFQADLAHAGEATRLVEEVAATWGGLDVLINNAGTYTRTPLAELSEAQWREGYDSTATAAFFTTRAALPLLARSGHGRVINIGDSAVDKLTARDLAMSYHVGKTGVLLLTKSFAARAAVAGITVNMISPGILHNSIDLDEQPPIPAGRLGTFDDIWNAAAFLLRPESQYLTGSNLQVTGGWNL